METKITQTEAVTTIIAKKKILLARAGQREIAPIVQMAFGSGGTDAEGNALEPTETQDSLNKELLRKAIDAYEIISDTQIKYSCTLEEYELVGEKISEIALIDADGDIVAIKNCIAKGKDGGWKMVFKVSDTM